LLPQKGETMTPILIIPGLGDSGPHHWQTHLERSFPSTSRVNQDDWDRPDRADWLERLAAAVIAAPGAVLVAHSLGCALVAHLAAERPQLAIAAALLVAPADVESRDHTPDHVRGFAPIPCRPLPFRGVVVASTNDPYIALSRASEFAKAWNTDFVNVGPMGHINIEAGFGPWPAGERILRDLLIRQRRPHTPPATVVHAGKRPDQVLFGSSTHR
jgi:predicted alpha/beta hydrolase family esterase